MNARYYVPYLNRFISADTIVPDPTNPQSFNRYSYTNNNPVNYVDPSGHAAQFFEGGNGNCQNPLDCYYPENHPNAGEIILTYPEEIAANRGKALNGVAMLPYVDTADDVATLLTGCGIACQAGYEEPLGWGWRTVAGIGIIAPLGVRSVRTAAGLIDEVVDGGSDIVYRALRADDRRYITYGLFGRSWPADEVSPISHVANQHHSPWISTGTEYDRIRDTFDSGNGIAVIDLSKVDSMIVDFSNGIPGYEGTWLSNAAQYYGEKLVKDFIPPESIIDVID